MEPSQLDFEIHMMSAADIDEVLDIQAECGLSAWSGEGYRAEIEDRDSICLIIKNESEIAGFLVAGMLQSEMSGELYNIGVRRKYRRFGLGTGLLQCMTEKASEIGVNRIFLEVRKSNQGAIYFYEKHRFKAVGIRRNFYTNPAEDGISMQLLI